MEIDRRRVSEELLYISPIKVTLISIIGIVILIHERVSKMSTKASLRRQVLLKLKGDYKDLFSEPKTTSTRRILDYMSDRKHWYAVLMLVVTIIIFMVFIHLDFLSVFTITDSSATVLIDQRISNVATVISMTIAIIGLLVSNLAVKEPLAYQVLFKKSRLYFIIYFTLSTIVCLIFISTFRNALPIDYQHYYSRAVLAGTYLVITIIFFIGFLVQAIIRFTNSEHIHKYLSDELILEVEEKMKLALMQQYFADQFELFMKSKNLQKRGWLTENLVWGVIEATTEAPVKTAPAKIIYDINLVRLGNLIDKHYSNGNGYYSALTFDGPTESYDNYIWVDTAKNTSVQRDALKACLKLKKVGKARAKMSYIQYFDSKLDYFVEKGASNDVGQILDQFLNIYKHQLKRDHGDER